MTVLVDPWSLTWKGDFDDFEAAEAYVERLTNIFELSKNEVLSLAISDASAELLTEDEVYPLVAQLPEAFWPNRADVYRLVAALLEKLPKLSRVGLLAVLVDEAVSVPPITFTVSAKHAAHVDELVAIALIARERSLPRTPVILSAHAPDSAVHDCHITAADVECVSPPEARVGLYQGCVGIRPTVNACVSDLNAVDLLVHGFVERAIALQVWKDRGAEGPNPFSVEGWKLGREFTRTIGDCGIAVNSARAEALLRACSRLIRGDALRVTHALRKSSSGGAPQITRSSDGAAAWRADIDYEYHLHYWLVGGQAEFANVVVHNDFTITM